MLHLRNIALLEKAGTGSSDVEAALADLKRSAVDFAAAVRRLERAVSAAPSLAGPDPGARAVRGERPWL
jgi:hypothetical protein